MTQLLLRVFWVTNLVSFLKRPSHLSFLSDIKCHPYSYHSSWHSNSKASYHQVAVKENNVRTLHLGLCGVIKGHKVLLVWVGWGRALIKKKSFSFSFSCIFAKEKCRFCSDILEDTFFCLKKKGSKSWWKPFYLSELH